MHFFHTFSFIFVYKKRHISFSNHINHQLNSSTISDLQPPTVNLHSPIFSNSNLRSSPTSMAAAPAVASTPREWTYEELITTVLTSNEDTIHWLQSKGLLASSMDCSKCSSQCRLVKRKGTLYWRCPRKGCQAVISVRDKSFFSTSRLSIQTSQV